MTDFGRDALTLPASDDARRSGEWVAGCLETPAVILDWRYATSPFALEMAHERLLGTAAPSDSREGAWSPYALPALPPLLGAANDNARLWVVR